MATIVSLDVAGYTRHMHQDEDAALARFKARTALAIALCEKAGGRVFGFAGDSFMIEFANSVDAMRCAVTLQEAVADANTAETALDPMCFRAGLNAGLVIAEGEALYGDAVNIAARIAAQAQPGGIALSEAVWLQVSDKFDMSFIDRGRVPLKNLPGETRLFGYGEGALKIDMQFQKSAKVERGPTVAVLRFRNTHAGEDPDYINEALADDLIASLSRHRWLGVISRQSSFQYDIRELTSPNIASALGTRYLVSGSLERIGDDLRISVTLEDAPNARVIWQDDIRIDPSQLITVHDRIGAEIAARLTGELGVHEQSQAITGQIDDLETWQLVHRGNWHLARRSQDDNGKARDCYEQALARDPNQPDALFALAWWYFWQAWLGHGGADAGHYISKVKELCSRAMLMDSLDARGHAYLGAVEVMARRPERARGYFSEALRLNPSFAFAHSGMGSALLLSGDPVGAQEPLTRFSVLSPADPYAFHNYGELAAAHYFSGDHQGTILASSRSLMLAPGYWYARILRIAATVAWERGDMAMQAAREDLDELYRLDSDFSFERIRHVPFGDPQWAEEIIKNLNKL
ncbi:adenylate/guanylate cyclase domain-containing protein [Paracoccaceae bacterium GXU_MW_L88]